MKTMKLPTGDGFVSETKVGDITVIVEDENRQESRYRCMEMAAKRRGAVIRNTETQRAWADYRAEGYCRNPHTVGTPEYHAYALAEHDIYLREMS